MISSSFIRLKETANKAIKINHQYIPSRQTLAGYAFFMYVATPLLAIGQGTVILSDYRRKHKDAPHPVVPARGIAVAVGRKSTPSSTTLTTLNSKQPLRLLVVGDSLAAGVGISKSGIPILPESIARALSQACGGRAVYWTCVGTPGVSSSQIIRDIHQLEASSPPDGRLEVLYKEWHAKRRKWQRVQERILHRSLGDDSERGIKKRDFWKEWWHHILENPRSPKHIQRTSERMTRDWWKRTTAKVQATKRRVEDDLEDIKIAIMQQSTMTDDDNNEGIHDVRQSEVTAHSDVVLKGSLFRRDSVNPDVVCAEYDIAVVLMGLNDIKEAFMPHMTMGNNSTMEGTDFVAGGMKTRFLGVLHALQDKMKRLDLEPASDHGKDKERQEEVISRSQEEKDSTMVQPYANVKRPLVVVPELPVAPLELFQIAPLCWFLVPLFRAMENNKKFLSHCFPDNVVFIPQPDFQWWEDVEAGLGPIRQNIDEERLLLQRTDVNATVRDGIKKLMQQHYNPVIIPSTENVANGDSSGQIVWQLDDDDHPQRMEQSTGEEEADRTNAADKKTKSGSTSSPYIAVDKIHPNDEGYELWGRHIAAAIVQHWNR